MTMRGLDRRPILRYVPAALLATLVGLLHRRAAVDAWLDDRSLAVEPSWVQMAAPTWHSAIHESLSIANAITRLVDPFTGASTAGDVRALAAILAGLSAGTLLLLLRPANVPVAVAIALGFAVVGQVLPVAAAVSPTYALQQLVGAALILTWSASFSRPAVRLGLLAAITALGVVAHASFLAFAVGLWAAECFAVAPGARLRVAGVGAGTLTVSLLLTSWLLAHDVTSPLGIAIDRPGLVAMARGILTGRFAGGLQPSHAADFATAISVCMPAPMILCAPLAALGFVRRKTRPLAAACALAAGALLVFVAGSWLPDPHVAGAPARVAVLALIGLGLSWVAAQPGTGAMTLAVLAGGLIGVRGFVEPTSWLVSVKTAQLQAFTEAAPEVLNGAAWSADHLAVIRAFLSANPDVASSRVPAQSDVLAEVPADRPIMALGDVAQAPSTGARLLTIPLDVPYLSAARFLAALPERLWMAVAIHDEAIDGFCADLLALLGADADGPGQSNTTVLARLGEGAPRAHITGTDRLDVEYGRALTNSGDPVPARFAIEASPVARVLINRELVARADVGMAIATFDPWTSETENWLVGPCSHPVLPAIRDARFDAAYAIESGTQSRPLRIPVLTSASIDVRFDVDDWIGSGWHDAERGGAETFRWTSAREAHINVPVTHRQPLRVRMQGALATGPGVPNALGLLWNGHVVRPLSGWSDLTESEWTVPEALVRRAVNVFTIQVAHLVSPAAFGASGDGRQLGAIIRQLSFEPIASSIVR